MAKPTDISKQLKRGPLRQVIQRSEDLQQWGEELQQRLAAPLCTHCHLANIRNDTAVVQCDSPVWASRLRYQSAVVLAHINEIQHQHDVKRLQISVRPPSPSTGTTRGPKASLSEESSQHLASVAKNTNDPLLRSMLLRLSGRGRTDSTP